MDSQNETPINQQEIQILWTVQQAARYLSLNPGTIYNWISKKQVLDPNKLVRFSNRVRIPRDEIMRIAGIVTSKLRE